MVNMEHQKELQDEQERQQIAAKRIYDQIYNRNNGLPPCSEDEEIMGDCEDEDSIQDEEIDRFLANEQKVMIGADMKPISTNNFNPINDYQ